MPTVHARRPAIASIALLAVVTALAHCDSSNPPTSQPATTASLRVSVAIPPQVYFVKRIGGDRVSVHAVLSAGQSHGAFDPSPKQMALLAGSRVFFRIGVGFEGPLLRKLADVSPQTEIVDTRDGIELLRLAEHGHDDEHDHDEDHVCGDSELDPHIWLDPVLVKTQARTICAALSRLEPANADEFRRNLAAFEVELDELDSRIAETLKPYGGRMLIVFHPSFAYFCRRYELSQLVIETAGKEPGPRRISDLIKSARKAGTKVVFAQEEYSAAGAQAVAEAIGGRVVRLAPMSADWAANLLGMTEAIAAGFQPS